MNKVNIFPRRYYAENMGSWVQMPEPAPKIWQRIKPKGMVWYSVDFEIVDENTITIFVYNMKDSYHGGIGDLIHTVTMTEFQPDERAVIDKKIEGLKWEAACIKFEEIENAERLAQIRKIKEEMFGV